MAHKHIFGNTQPAPKWIGIFVHDLNASKYRVFSKELTQPIITAMTEMPGGVDVAEHMIRDQYLNKQFTTNMDRWHYINWCYGYADKTNFSEQQTRKLIVAVQVSDTEPEVNAFLQYWLDQVDSKMDLSKVTYGHKPTK